MKETKSTRNHLSSCREVEIAVMLGAEFADELCDGKFTAHDLICCLRNMVREVGVGYTDSELTQMAVNFVRCGNVNG